MKRLFPTITNQISRALSRITRAILSSKFNFFLQSPRRAAIHAPIGALNAWLLHRDPAIGFAMLAGFFVYELDECLHLKDGAYKDIQGYVVSLVVCGVILNIL